MAAWLKTLIDFVISRLTNVENNAMLDSDLLTWACENGWTVEGEHPNQVYVSPDGASHSVPENLIISTTMRNQILDQKRQAELDQRGGLMPDTRTFSQREADLAHENGRAKRKKKKDKDKDGSPRCPVCRGKMALRTGKFGTFWGCLAYPECRGTLQAAEPNTQAIKIDESKVQVEQTLEFVKAVGGFQRAHQWIQIVEQMTRAAETPVEGVECPPTA